MSWFEKLNFKTLEDLKEFNKEDSKFKFLEYCEETDKYLYGRYYLRGVLKNKLLGYEVVKLKKYTNKDGSIGYSYPGNSEFGLYGWFLPASSSREDIEKYLYKK